MTHPLPPSTPPGADTPVDERPPYGDGPRWAAVILIVVGIAVVLGAVASAILCALVVVVGLVALVRRAAGQRRREGVIFMNGPDVPYAGPTYRVQFYDGDYRQLTDLDLSIALPALRGPAADAALDALGRELHAEVEARDSQRCFRPRVVVVDGLGNTLRSWRVTA